MPKRRQLTRRLVSLAIVMCTSAVAAGAAGLVVAPAASAGTLRLKVCGRWSPDQGPFRAHTPAQFGWDVQCGSQSLGLELWSILRKKTSDGTTAQWLTRAPRGIRISHASVVHPHSRNVGDAHGWAGAFFWHGGSVAVTGRYNKKGCCARHFRSRTFGWRITCVARACRQAATLDVGGIELLATETRAPVIAPSGTTNLWFHAGQWVRGTWPVAFTARDPSGACRIAAVLGDERLPGPSDRANTDSWQQCPDRTWKADVDTANAHGPGGASQGAMPLSMSASNAAGVRRSRTETVYVDNTQPWVKIAGHSDAPSTAGTQYLRATAGGSPSGIAGISCRVDRRRTHSYSGSSARVPVSGVGAHTIRCRSEDRAVGPAGKHGVSRVATWKLMIRRPTTITALFGRFVPRHVVTVWVRDHGHWVKRKAIIPAHTVHSRRRRIPFGARTTIGGRLSVKGGRGLRDQVVVVRPRRITVPSTTARWRRSGPEHRGGGMRSCPPVPRG